MLGEVLRVVSRPLDLGGFEGLLLPTEHKRIDQFTARQVLAQDGRQLVEQVIRVPQCPFRIVESLFEMLLVMRPSRPLELRL